MNIKQALSNILHLIFGPANDVDRIELSLQRLADEAEAAADAKSRKIDRLRQQIDELEADEEAAMEDRVRLRQLANRAYELAADGLVSQDYGLMNPSNT